MWRLIGMNDFEALQEFKTHLQEDLIQKCLTDYGRRVFSVYIKEVLDDTLEHL